MPADYMWKRFVEKASFEPEFGIGLRVTHAGGNSCFADATNAAVTTAITRLSCDQLRIVIIIIYL